MKRGRGGEEGDEKVGKDEGYGRFRWWREVGIKQEQHNNITHFHPR